MVSFRPLFSSLLALTWLMMPKGERPHPRHSHRHSGRLYDAADDKAIGEHVEVVTPFA
jgi:hypothetical protein